MAEQGLRNNGACRRLAGFTGALDALGTSQARSGAGAAPGHRAGHLRARDVGGAVLVTAVGVDGDLRYSRLYDAVAALGGRQFDVEYVSIGSLIWLPDVPRWAAVAATLLRPGRVPPRLERIQAVRLGP